MGIMLAIGAAILAVFIIVRMRTSLGDAASVARGDGSSSKHFNQLLETLDGLGFYRYAPPDRIDELKQEARTTGYIFGWEETVRDYHADAEDLAEGGVQEFFARINPFLKVQGVQINSIKQNFTDKGYTITINERDYQLYSEEELVFEKIWGLTSDRTLAIANTLLEEAGSNERAFGLYGGNDQHIVFLTNEMYEAIRRSAVLPQQDMPIPAPTP